MRFDRRLRFHPCFIAKLFKVIFEVILAEDILTQMVCLYGNTGAILAEDILTHIVCLYGNKGVTLAEDMLTQMVC